MTSSYLDLHVFRVSEGLGNACLLDLPDGTCGVVDWGTQSEETLETALGIVGEKRLRFVAASHAHADHTLGLAGLIETCHRHEITIDRFVYPASTLHRSTAYLTRARLAARDRGIAMSAIAVDDFVGPRGRPDPPYLAWSDDPEWDVRVLSPSLTRIGSSETGALGREIVPGNETSLVILFRFGVGAEGRGYGRALLPGDATPSTLEFARRTALESSVSSLVNQAFVVPHHGSSKNLPEWLVDDLHGIAVISSPTHSRHHPSAPILERLSRRTSRGAHDLYCTSYARCCAEDFGKRATGGERRHVHPGSCFGDIVIRVPLSEPARLERSSAPGDHRRPFGYCGNVTAR